MITWFSRKKKHTVPSVKKDGDDFVSLSSHALRSPLSIIKWYTEILLDGDAGPLTEDQRKYLMLIESSNQRAIDLVRSLLNVSRLDLGTFSITLEEISINAIVNEAVNALSLEAKKKDVEIVQKEDVTIKNINADKHLCLLIFKQLLSNAVLFSKKGGDVTISTASVTKSKKIDGVTIGEESILITVTDKGIGIPEADKSKIFSKMFKASNVKDSQGAGSGLSLYIIKSVLEHSGGNIWFTSTENVGTTFFVTLPTRGMIKKEGRTTLD